MENATKALLIAAGLLIALMIISAGIYLFVNYSEVVYQHDKNRATQSQVQYNNKFEKFVDKELTAQDVVTIINLKDDYNEGRPDSDQIKIILNGFNIVNTDKGKFEFLNNTASGKNTKYTYKIEKIDKNEETNTIKTITINKIMHTWSDAYS